MANQQIKTVIQQAQDEFEKGNFAEVERICENAISSTDILLQTQQHIDVLVLLVSSLIVLGKVNYALPYALQALGLILTLPATKDHEPVLLQAKTQLLIGGIYWRQSQWAKALESYQIAEALYTSVEDRNGIARSIGNQGIVHMHKSEYELALSYFQKALTMLEELADKEGMETYLSNIGNVHVLFGDYAKALHYYQTGLKLCEEIGDKKRLASSFGNIGVTYTLLENLEESLIYFHNALEIDSALSLKGRTATHLGNIGSVYHKKKLYEVALEYISKATVINIELDKKELIGHNHGTLGLLHTDLNDYEQAFYHYSKAIEIFRAIEYKHGLSMNIAHIGRLYTQAEFNNYNEQKAEEYFLEALAIAEHSGLKAQRHDTHKSLSALYKQQGKWQESLQHFETYHQLEKEVQSEEATKQAQQMENRRKVEEAERDRQVKLARFQEQEKILLNILPAPIAERILQGEKQIADYCENVSIFFSDIVGFTQISQAVSPDELVTMLNEIFSEFDRIARKYGLEKIKTIGDSYMAVAGVPMPLENHAECAALFAIEVTQFMHNYRQRTGNILEIRIGVHSGNAVAGVIGENKFAYDLWGDAVKHSFPDGKQW